MHFNVGDLLNKEKYNIKLVTKGAFVCHAFNLGVSGKGEVQKFKYNW